MCPIDLKKEYWIVKRTLMPIAVGIVLTLASVQVVAAAPIESAAATFTVSPTSLSFSAQVGDVDYDLVTVTTGRKAIVLQSPSSSSSPEFGDTHYGTCWQQYLSVGQKIPANSSCTIQVGFISYSPGSFTGTLTVAECLRWTIHPSGAFSCSKAGQPQSIALSGTATPGLPDLTVLGIGIINAGPVGDAEYRVDLLNQGAASVMTNVSVEGYWSTDETSSGDDTPACSEVSLAPLPSNTVTPVFIKCPTLPADTDRYLLVILDHWNFVDESDELNNLGIAPLPPR